MGIRDKNYIVTMPDGSRWSIPVEVIAKDRALHYYLTQEFESTERSLEEDTWPLFEEDSYEVQDWARNNMNWEDVEEFAILIKDEKEPVDFQEGWVNGDVEIL